MNYRKVAERMAGYLNKLDIDEDICKKVHCGIEEPDECDCVDCILNFFSKECIFVMNEVCVNDESEHCADFVDATKCGGCKCRKVEIEEVKGVE